jgi:hypothetical protein
MYAWGNFAISYLAINGAISYSAIAYAVDRYIYIHIVVGYLKQSNGWFCLTVNILVTCRDITTMSLEIVLINLLGVNIPKRHYYNQEYSDVFSPSQDHRD